MVVNVPSIILPSISFGPVHPFGVPRPDAVQIKWILENYDGVILGTSQKISEEMFERITTPRVIGTASVGIDHIHVPEAKRNLVKIYNTPKANAQSVAEYTIGCALMCCKRLVEAGHLYLAGRDNKNLKTKPEDLSGKTLGVVGAGNISKKIMEYGQVMGMEIICWTAHPENHQEISGHINFVSLSELSRRSDVISVNLPNNDGTKNIISDAIIEGMKETAIFISVSRLDTIDYKVLLNKASMHQNFYVCMDVDVDNQMRKFVPSADNVMITPHIAGGTAETRKRMFREVSQQIANMYRN